MLYPKIIRIFHLIRLTVKNDLSYFEARKDIIWMYFFWGLFTLMTSFSAWSEYVLVLHFFVNLFRDGSLKLRFLISFYLNLSAVDTTTCAKELASRP